MKKMKRIFAVSLAMMLTIQMLPSSLFTIHAIAPVSGNEYVSVKAENASSAKASKFNEELQVEEALASHALNIVVKVDGSIMESTTVSFNEYDPGRTVVEALNGYEITSATLDGAKFDVNGTLISFTPNVDESKDLVINVAKIAKEEKGKAISMARGWFSDYEVQFYVNGRRLQTDYVDQGEVPAYKGVPTRSYGEFVGWATELNSKNYIPKGQALPEATGDKTYYAIFEGTSYFYFVLPGKSNTSTNARDYMYAGSGKTIIIDQFGTSHRLYDNSQNEIAQYIVSTPNDAAIRNGLAAYYDGKNGREKYDDSWTYEVQWSTYSLSGGSVDENYVMFDEATRVHVDAKITVNTNTKRTISYRVENPDGNIITQSTTHLLNDRVGINESVKPTGTFTTDSYRYDAQKQKDGITYQFDGWYTNQAFNTKAPAFIEVDDSATYYGRYVTSTRSLTFDANGGQFNDGTSMQLANHKAGDTARLTSVPKKVGYKFDGWVRDDNLNDLVATATSVKMPDYDLTLSAKWKLDSDKWFDVTYEDGRGNKVVKKDLALANNEVDVLAFDGNELNFQVESGKYFTEWKLTSGNAEHTNNKIKFKDSDVTLTAQYGDLYNIYFYANLKNDEILELVNDNDYMSGDVYSLPEYDGDHDASGNHNFLGWTTNPQLLKELSNKEGVVNKSENVEELKKVENGFVANGSNVTFANDDIELYAIWANKQAVGVEVSYTVEFYKDNVLVSGDTITHSDYVLSTEIKQLPFVTAVDQNKYEADGYVYSSITPAVVLNQMIPDQSVIKVNYTKDPLKWFTVTYKAGTHGTGTDFVQTDKARENDAVAVVAYADTNFKVEKGYTFVGWEVTSGGVTLSNDSFTMGTSDVVLTAKYEKLDFKYSVHYYYDDKEDTSLTVTKEVAFDTKITTYDKQEKVGFALDYVEGLPLTVGVEEDKNIIHVYYAKDVNGDKIPDKYQKEVTFKVVNGAWNDETTTNVKAIVNLVDADGKYAVDGKATLTDVIPAVGNKADATYEGYVFERMEPTVKAGDKVADNTVITLYYDVDANKDVIADKYQAVVSFQAINGTVSIEETYVTLFDEQGNYAVEGTGYLQADQIPTATANAGFDQTSLVWLSGEPTQSTLISKDSIFTVAFSEIVVVPTTPVTPTPTLPLPIPAVPAPAPAPASTPVPPVVEDVENKETPKANLGSWAMINLIATTGTVLLGLFILLAKRRKEEENEENETPEEKKRNLWLRILTTLIAVASVIAFLLTEDMTLKMALFDKWTIAMVVLFAVQAVAFIFARRWKEVKQENTSNR